MKRITAILCLFASSCYANDKRPIDPVPECCGCDSHWCDRECLCPVYTVLPNGQRVVFTLESEHPMWRDTARPAIGFAWFFNKPKRIWR